MKTLKFNCILCIVLAFVYCNSNAQKPIVANHDEGVWGIDPSPDLPCLTESISGLMVMDGFFTNSSREVAVYNYTYHEKGGGTLTGTTTGEYEADWNFNSKEMSYDGFPKQSVGMWHINVTQNGKLFMTVTLQYVHVWNEPWTWPKVWRNVYKIECK
jgi:hypothetical protein